MQQFLQKSLLAAPKYTNFYSLVTLARRSVSLLPLPRCWPRAARARSVANAADESAMMKGNGKRGRGRFVLFSFTGMFLCPAT
jgi:hypothetical protein